MPPASAASQSWEESKGICDCDLQWGTKAKHAGAYEHIEHELLCSLDFTDTIEEFVLAN